MSALATLLQKAHSYGLPITFQEKTSAFLLRDIINNHEVEQKELTDRISKIQAAKFEEESIRKAQEVILRLHQRVQEQTELSEWQVEVLDKAAQYGLKYNLNNPDWFKLNDDIEELEMLLPFAEQYGIYDWDANDIIDLKQKIEAGERKWCAERDSQYRDYLFSRI